MIPDSIDPAAQIKPPTHQPYIQPKADMTTVEGTGRTMSETSSAIPAAQAHEP
jgi:hypothetical protein